jgi:hypothetical protein
VWSGASALDYFSAAEYAGGHDALSLALPSGADTVEVELLYQTTSREYVGFLRSELSASGATLTSPTPSGEANAYIATTDPFFSPSSMPGGEVVWSLWEHTKSWPGAAPARMAYAVVVAGNGCAAPVADGTPCQDGDACTVSDTCQGGVCVPGAALACDDANPCTTDGCDPAWGCVHGWTTDPCDDGSACTAKDLCAFGVCAGLLALVCNDGDPCTDNACDPASGCVYEPIVDCTGAGGGGGTGGAGGSGGTGGGGHGGSGGEPNAEGGGGASTGPEGAAPRPGDDAACACGVPGAPGGDGSGQLGLLLLAASLAARRWPRLRDLSLSLSQGFSGTVPIQVSWRSTPVTSSRVTASPASSGGGAWARYGSRGHPQPADVAIKVLLARAALKPDLVKRFEREAEIASAINSPYVCQLIDVGQTDDDVPLLIFEYLAASLSPIA